MVYCCSDIHGEYHKYLKLIKKIKLKEEDTLFILGDVIDRGEKSIEVLQDMMYRANVIPILGNHEYIAIQILPLLMQEITEENISEFNEEFVKGLLEWLNIGGQSTIDGFKKLSKDDKQDMINYLMEFSLYEEVRVNGNDYVLVHAGLSNFSPERRISDYELYEVIFERPEYYLTYFKDKYLVTGHTPTRFIEDNEKPDFIYKGNNHIAIDCGAIFGGKLAAICLDTGEEFYI